MEKLNSKINDKFENAEKACKSLERSINLYKNPRPDVTEIELEAFRTSVIKNFELCFETLWKYLKEYLFFEYGLETKASKDVLRTCRLISFINDEELKRCLSIVDDRNESTHIYEDKFAEELIEHIIDHYTIMKEILERTKK